MYLSVVFLISLQVALGHGQGELMEELFGRVDCLEGGAGLCHSGESRMDYVEKNCCEDSKIIEGVNNLHSMVDQLKLDFQALQDGDNGNGGTEPDPAIEELKKAIEELNDQIKKLDRRIKKLERKAKDNQELADCIEDLKKRMKKVEEQGGCGSDENDTGLSDDELKEMLDEYKKQLKEAVTCLKEWYKEMGDFDKLPFCVRKVLIKMIMEIGKEEMNKFRRLKQAVKDKDWAEAAKHMKSSNWYKNNVNKKRIDEMADKIKNTDN